MLDYLPEEVLTLRVSSAADVEVPRLPRMYTREFEIGVFVLDGINSNVRFVAIGSRTRPDLKMLKGAFDSLRQACDLPVVTVSPSLDYWQKEWLVSRQMPFIQDERNLFLPFAGFIVQEPTRGRRPSPLSPQAQRIVVNLIMGSWDGITAGELSERVGKSRSSISKYLAEIEAICPETVSRTGRTTKLCRNGLNSAALLDRFEPYLKTPVSRRFRISSDVNLDELKTVGARLSGLSALQQLSDLSTSEDYPTIAIAQEGLAKAMVNFGDAGGELPWWDEEGTCVEVWDYWDDLPIGLQNNSHKELSHVGALSLYLSLKDRYSNDVRVADAIDQLREDVCQ